MKQILLDSIWRIGFVITVVLTVVTEANLTGGSSGTLSLYHYMFIIFLVEGNLSRRKINCKTSGLIYSKSLTLSMLGKNSADGILIEVKVIGMDTLWWEAILSKRFWFPFWKRVYSKRKEQACKGAKLFSFFPFGAGCFQKSLASLSTLFNSYQDNERVIMKCSVQWSMIESWSRFGL